MSPWKVEEGGLSEGGCREWHVVVRRTGGIVGTFTDRVAPLACVRGFDAIGFVPKPAAPPDQGGDRGGGA